MVKQHVLVTGGAGFIGSHLADVLLRRGFKLTVIDNLSSGSLDNIDRWIGNADFRFVKRDLLSFENVIKVVEDCNVVFHLAANPEVRVGTISPDIHFSQNVMATHNLLEALRKTGKVKVFAFTSSSTIYGEASMLPTPEDYSPLKPISIYGASKLACEALITAYAYTYGFRGLIYRLANVVGPRSRIGVAVDFVEKLRKSPRQLEILGDGTQNKSYVYVDDCVDAMLLGLEKAQDWIEVYNVGSEDRIDVMSIAKIVAGEMALENVNFRCDGGVVGGRGWKGDVKNMLLDIGKLTTLGWKPQYKSAEAIRMMVKHILKNTS